MTQNPLAIVTGWFETEFAQNCKYAWPFTLELAEYVFDNASSHDTFIDLIKLCEIFTINDVNENDAGYSSENEEYQEYKEALLIETEEFFNDLKKSAVLEWPYSKVVCSAIFFILDTNLQTEGTINSDLWFKLVSRLVSLNSEIRTQLCACIEKNGFFKLNPQLAIDGAKQYFAFQNRILYFFELVNDNDQEEIVFSILKLLQLTEKDSKILVNESLTNKNFSKLIEFLDNYKVEKAKSITLQQLQSVLQNIKLNNSQKSEIIENIYSQLDAANPLDILASWEDLTLSSNSQAIVFYENLPEKQKQEALNKELFTLIQKSISKIELYKSKEFPYKVIYYPPLEIIESNLMNLSQEERNNLYNFFFSGNSSLDSRPIPSTLLKSIAVLGLCIVLIFSFPGRTDAIILPSQLRSAESARVYTRIPRSTMSVPTKATAYLDEKPSLVNTRVQSDESSQESKILLCTVPKTDHKFRARVSGGQLLADLTGIHGEYGDVKLIAAKIRKAFEKGQIRILEKEVIGDITILSVQADHLLMENTRENCGLPRETSVSILVMSEMNVPKTATEEARKILTRSLSYTDLINDKTPLIELQRSQVLQSFQVVSTNLYQDPTNYLEGSRECLEKNLPLALKTHEDQLNYVLIDPYNLPPGYDTMFVEGIGILRGITKDADTIVKSATDPRVTVDHLLNTEFIDYVSKNFEHMNDLKIILNNDMTLSTAAIEFIERKQEIAVNCMIGAITQLEQIKRPSITQDQKQLCTSVRRSITESNTRSTGAPTLALLDQRARAVGVHSPHGKHGKFQVGGKAKLISSKGVQVGGKKKMINSKSGNQTTLSRVKKNPQTDNSDNRFVD